MRKICLTAAAAFCVCGMLMAQTPSDIRINEVVLECDSAGAPTKAWVELFNTSYTALDMAGLYISDNASDLKSFRVPSGTPATQFLPRGYVVIEADGCPGDGPLHTPFALSGNSVIYLVEANGRVVIDSLSLSGAGIYARAADGSGEWQKVQSATRAQSNSPVVAKSNVDLFAEVDPNGGGVALISMSVVFSVLVLLAVVFTLLGKMFKGIDARKAAAAAAAEAPKAEAASGSADDDIEQALATAVLLYKRDMEQTQPGKLTIVQRQSAIWKSFLIK